MNLNTTPSSERIHIGIFGKTNSGKSSLINALTSQNLSIVSDIKGTTTDPVRKAMELLPLGPVVLIDTPGINDHTLLGSERIKKAENILKEIDVAILVVDIKDGLTFEDKNILKTIEDKNIPYITVFNKADTVENSEQLIKNFTHDCKNILITSCKNGLNIEAVKEMLGKIVPLVNTETPLISDLIDKGDFCILVVPIDESAPKGRLILPQQQTIREILDKGAVSIVVKDKELKETLENIGKKPKLVVTDSQVFKKVAPLVPDDIFLTSFSILFARYKGDLPYLVKGADVLDSLNDGDTILISEGCTHHRQCNDIGTVKLPAMLKKYTNKELKFEFTSGRDFPENLNAYKLIIHCGGCTLTATQMKERINFAKEKHIPITNYGVAMAKMQGILKRNIKIFNM